jgi:hypothetical protein
MGKLAFNIFGPSVRKKPKNWTVHLGKNDQTCLLCGKKRTLQRAHIRAKSKGGGPTVSLCYDCHRRYDGGKATASDLRKLGITRGQYSQYRPKRVKSGSRRSRKYALIDVDKSLADISKAVRNATKQGY